MIEPISIAELARQEIEGGAKIVLHDGVWWNEVQPFFYQPLDLTQAVRSNQRPPWKSLLGGYRAAVGDPGRRNSALKILAIVGQSLVNYSLSSVDAKRRNLIRKGLRDLEITNQLSLEVCLRDGPSLVRSFNDRTRWGKRWTEKTWAEWIYRVMQQPKRVTLGALCSGKLIGILRGFLVSETRTAYLSFIATHTDYLHFYPNEALIFTFIMMMKEAKPRMLLFGIPSNKTSLDRFKRSMGFSIVALNSFVWMNPVVKLGMRTVGRSKYERLIGS